MVDWKDADVFYQANQHNENFYERQASIDECRSLLESAIQCIAGFEEFKEEVKSIEIALDEVKEKEKEY